MSDGSQLARVRRSAAFPGLVLFFAVYGAVVFSGGRFLYREARGLWQHLPPEALDAEFGRSLLYLHTQPPGFNALLGVVDRLGPYAPYAWQFGYWLIACVLVGLTAQTTLRVTTNLNAGRLAGILVAILPTTVLYSLWPAYALPVSLLIVAMVWGVARANATGYVVSMTAALFLFFTRSSFIWLLAAAWIVTVALLAAKARSTWRTPMAAFALTCLALIGLVQARSVILFGSWSQSTWAGQNLVHALEGSRAMPSEVLLAASREDSCFNLLIERGTFNPAPPSGDLMEACGSYQESRRVLHDAKALDIHRSAAGQYNFNNRSELALAPAWQALALKAVRTDPTSLLRVVTGANGQQGTLRIMLSRSDTYNQVAPNWEAVPWYFGSLWPLSVLWPFATFGLIVLGVPALLLWKRARGSTPVAYWLGTGLLSAVALVGLIGEYGENQRFRVELDPLAAVLAVSTIWLIFRSWRSSAHDRSLG